MSPGDLVVATCHVDICEDYMWSSLIATIDPTSACLLLETRFLTDRSAIISCMCRVLTPCGRIGWAPAVHFRRPK